MKKSLQHSINRIVPLVSLQWLIQVSGVHTVLPFYHTVSDTDLPHLKHLYPVLRTQTFEKHLDYLLKHYQPADYKHLLSDHPSQGNHFILSFDDGLRQFYEVAVPVLIKKGIPAICFINTGFIDNKAMFYRMKTSLLVEHLLHHSTPSLHDKITKSCAAKGLLYSEPGDLKKITDRDKTLTDELGAIAGIDFDQYLKAHQPYMSSEELKELRNQGFAIGAHSVTHPYYPALNEEQQIDETLTSVREVKEKFNIEDGLFSFPYTDFEIRKSFFEAVKNDVKLTFGTANLKNDCIPTNFQRIPMELFGLDDPELLIKSQYVLHSVKKWIGKNTIKRS